MPAAFLYARAVALHLIQRDRSVACDGTKVRLEFQHRAVDDDQLLDAALRSERLCDGVERQRIAWAQLAGAGQQSRGLPVACCM